MVLGQCEHFEGNTRDTVCIVLHSLLFMMGSERSNGASTLVETQYLTSLTGRTALHAVEKHGLLCVYMSNDEWWSRGLSLGMKGKFIGMM